MFSYTRGVVEYYTNLRSVNLEQYEEYIEIYKNLSHGGEGKAFRNTTLRKQFYRGYSDEFFAEVLKELNEND